jgi:hypothetical protein
MTLVSKAVYRFPVISFEKSYSILLDDGNQLPALGSGVKKMAAGAGWRQWRR